MAISVTVIKRDGRKFFECRWIDPRTGLKKTQSTKTAVRREAERFAAKLEEKLKNGPATEVEDLAWKEFRKQYEEEVYPEQSPKTRETTKSTFNAIEKILRPARVSSITTAQVRKFKRKIRARTASKFSIKRHLTELRKILRWAVRSDILDEKSMPKIEMPKKVRGSKGRGITTEEFERILAAADGVLTPDQLPSWTFYMKGLFWSGLRLRESLQLHWTDDTNICVELSGRRPMFRIQSHTDKGREFRLLPMAPEFAELLETVPASEREGLVFQPIGRHTTAVPLANWICRKVSACGKKAGVKVMQQGEKVKYASAHDLRRAFGVRWSQRVLAPILMEMMRHESIQTTQEFYVGRNAEASADLIWSAFEENRRVARIGNTSGNTPEPNSSKP